MIRPDRRTVLKGALAAGAAVGTRSGAAGLRPALLVGDSALPLSRAFLGAHPLTATIDLAQDRLYGWKALRAAGGANRIEGLTRWSDWVAVRGALLAQGYRVTAEARVASPAAGPVLFRWTMVPRAALSR